jgi:hypothetical protein
MNMHPSDRDEYVTNIRSLIMAESEKCLRCRLWDEIVDYTGVHGYDPNEVLANLTSIVHDIIRSEPVEHSKELALMLYGYSMDIAYEAMAAAGSIELRKGEDEPELH